MRLHDGRMLTLLASMLIPLFSIAQEDDVDEAAANAANPLVFIAKVQGQPNFTWMDNDGRQVNLTSRIILPTASIGLPFIKSRDPSKVYTLYRLEVPIVSQTFPENQELDATGMSDVSLLDVIVVKQKWGMFGAGPALTIPVMKPAPISIRKWAAGFALVAMNTQTKGLQWGVLAQQFFTFAGDSERSNESFMLFQPIFNFMLSKGKFVQVNPIMNFNWTNQTYNIPIAINVGKAFSRSMSALIGPEYVISGPNENDFTFRFQLNAMIPP